MRFVGQWFDVDAQLVYNHHRWYDARVGRYLRPDPLFEQGQWQDPYMYVQGNPYTFGDPLGLTRWRDRALEILGDYSDSFDSESQQEAAFNHSKGVRCEVGGTNLDAALVEHYLFARGLLMSPGDGRWTAAAAGLASAITYEGIKNGINNIPLLGPYLLEVTDTSPPSFYGIVVVAEAINDYPKGNNDYEWYNDASMLWY